MLRRLTSTVKHLLHSHSLLVIAWSAYLIFTRYSPFDAFVVAKCAARTAIMAIVAFMTANNWVLVENIKDSFRNYMVLFVLYKKLFQTRLQSSAK